MYKNAITSLGSFEIILIRAPKLSIDTIKFIQQFHENIWFVKEIKKNCLNVFMIKDYHFLVLTIYYLELLVAIVEVSQVSVF